MNIKSVYGKLKVYAPFRLADSFFSKSDQKLSALKFPLPPLLRKSRVVAGSFILVLLILFFSVHSFSSSLSNVPTYRVKNDNFVVSITESGEIRAKNATSIVTPGVRGNMKIVYLIPEGTYVHAGDVAVRFDPTEAMTNLKDAQSRLEIAISDKAKLAADQKSQLTNLESALKEARLSFELSKLNLEQMKFEAEIKQQQSKLELERNQLNLTKAQQELESQKIIQRSEMGKTDIQVEQAKATLDKAKRDLDALTLKAPKEGLVVYETNWSTGRKIMIGDTPWPGTPLVSLPDLSAMQSMTYVNEVDASRVSAGQKVLVKLDAFQDSTFTGVISSVASLGRTKDRTSTIKVFEVDVDVLSQSPILKPGMTTMLYKMEPSPPNTSGVTYYFPGMQQPANVIDRNSVDELTAKVSNSDHVNVDAYLVAKILERKHYGIIDYELILPEALLAQKQKTQRIFNIVMGAIAGISLLVGGIGIMNIMLASILERTREIGLRRAVGATKNDVLSQFIYEALTISVAGGLTGIVVGFILTSLISTYADWKTIISLYSILLAFVISVTTGLIFGIYPAKQAADKNPIDSLRYE